MTDLGYDGLSPAGGSPTPRFSGAAGRLNRKVAPGPCFGSAHNILDYFRERTPNFVELRRAIRQQAETGIGVVHDGGKWLVDLMRNRGGQFSHGGDAGYMSEFGPRLVERILCALALGVVNHGAHEFNEIAGWAEHRVADCVDVSNLTAGMNDSVIQVELRLFTPCSFVGFPGLGLIIRMDALKESFVSRLPTLRVKTLHAVTLLGPVRDPARGGPPCPTARVAQPLRFR